MASPSPVKAMPAPAPAGFTTPPPMNQVTKMADKKEEKDELPSGAKGGIAGALMGALSAAPGIAKAHKAVPLKPPPGIPSHLFDKRRGELHTSVAKAVGASLLGAAMGVGAERMGKHMAKVLKDMKAMKDEGKSKD